MSERPSVCKVCGEDACYIVGTEWYCAKHRCRPNYRPVGPKPKPALPRPVIEIPPDIAKMSLSQVQAELRAELQANNKASKERRAALGKRLDQLT
jgi:hypothetical protein